MDVRRRQQQQQQQHTQPTGASTSTSTDTGASTKASSSRMPKPLPASLALELQQWAHSLGFGIEPSILPTARNRLLDKDAAEQLCKQQLNSVWSFLIRRVRSNQDAQEIRLQLQQFRAFVQQDSSGRFDQHAHLFEGLGSTARAISSELAHAEMRRDALAAEIEAEERLQQQLKTRIDEMGFQVSQMRAKVSEKQRKLLVVEAHARRIVETSALLLADEERLSTAMAEDRGALLKRRSTLSGIGVPAGMPSDEEQLVDEIGRMIKESVECPDAEPERAIAVDRGRLVALMHRSAESHTTTLARVLASADSSPKVNPASLVARVAKRHALRFVRATAVEEQNKEMEAEIADAIDRLAVRVEQLGLGGPHDRVLQVADSEATQETLEQAENYARRLQSQVDEFPSRMPDGRLAEEHEHESILQDLINCQTVLDGLVSSVQELIESERATLAANTDTCRAVSDDQIARELSRAMTTLKQSGTRLHEGFKQMSIGRAMATTVLGRQVPTNDWRWANDELMLRLRKESMCRMSNSFDTVLAELARRRSEGTHAMRCIDRWCCAADWRILHGLPVDAYKDMSKRMLRLRQQAESSIATGARQVEDARESVKAVSQEYNSRIIPRLRHCMDLVEQSHQLLGSTREIVNEWTWFVHKRDDPFASGGVLETYRPVSPDLDD
ncbi:hypothetical protein BC831DRAFT_447008 [Entophlyctis helioformis]|nr:hypothetical protein BC831DRAFT_447008 [Entophlyctis helioformis]